MSGDCEIRDWSPNDAAAWLEVHRAAVRAEATSTYSEALIEAWAPLPITPAQIDRFARNEAGERRLVAERADVIIGIAALRRDLGEVSACYVRPSATRGGVGRALLAALEREAVDAGLATLGVSSSLNAETFYAANGFVLQRRGVHRLAGGLEMPNAFLVKML